jgi:hypothetical protein
MPEVTIDWAAVWFNLTQLLTAWVLALPVAYPC